MPLKNKERLKKNDIVFFYLKVAKFFSYADEIITLQKFIYMKRIASYLKIKIVSLKKHHDADRVYLRVYS